MGQWAVCILDVLNVFVGRDSGLEGTFNVFVGKEEAEAYLAAHNMKGWRVSRSLTHGEKLHICATSTVSAYTVSCIRGTRLARGRLLPSDAVLRPSDFLRCLFTGTVRRGNKK